MFSDLKIVTGSSNPDLAKAICNHLGCQLTPTLATTFSDGELRIEIGDNVRGDDVFVVQPTCPPTVNRNLVQLCLMLDALQRGPHHGRDSLLRLRPAGPQGQPARAHQRQDGGRFHQRFRGGTGGHH